MPHTLTGRQHGMPLSIIRVLFLSPSPLIFPDASPSLQPSASGALSLVERLIQQIFVFLSATSARDSSLFLSSLFLPEPDSCTQLQVRALFGVGLLSTGSRRCAAQTYFVLFSSLSMGGPQRSGKERRGPEEGAMSAPELEWAEPVRKDDARTVRSLLERRPPAFELTDTVRAALILLMQSWLFVIPYAG